MRTLVSRIAFGVVFVAASFAVGFSPAEASEGPKWHCEKCRCEFPAGVCYCEGPCTFW